MRKWLIRIGVVINLTVVVAVVYVYRFRGPGALRAYDSELRAKGEKLTFEEVVATYSSNASDTAGILTNTILGLGPVSFELTNARLGSASSELTNIGTLKFIAAGQAEVSFRQDIPPWASSVKGRRCATWVGASNRLFVANSQLAKLCEALKSPSANAGPHDFFQKVTPFREVRDAAYWLGFAALENLHDGRKTEAVENVQALAHLANLHREEYSLLSQMTRVAVAQIGLAISWQASQADGWNDAQLAEVQKSWEAIDLLDGLERSMAGERNFNLQAFKRLKMENPHRSFSGKLYEWCIAPNDIRFGLENMQKRVELARKLRANEPWQNVSLAMEKIDFELQRKNVEPERYFYRLTLVSIPNLRPAFAVTMQAETKRKLVVAAVALKRYKLKNGKYPEMLDALAPSFVRTVPLDPMSGAPLRYRLNSDGFFALYSVGDDGKDNGGDPEPVADASSQPASVRAGIWGGRDVVWPLPATNVGSVITSGTTPTSENESATAAR